MPEYSCQATPMLPNTPPGGRQDRGISAPATLNDGIIGVMKVFILVSLLLVTIALVLSACGGLSEAEEHHNAGADLQEQGRLEEAIAEYDEAIRLDPQYSAAYNNRGAAYLDLGWHRRAIEDLILS